MSYIPNVRREKDYNKFTGEERNEPNPYYEGNLNAENKQIKNGYDFACNSIKSFFSNISIYEDALQEFFNTENIDEEVLTASWEDLNEEEIEGLSSETAICLCIKDCLLHYMEINRNELVTSLLEEQNENNDK